MERGITTQTMHFFGAGSDGSSYYFPYCDMTGKVVAAKTRSMVEKQFSVVGDWKSAVLFGQKNSLQVVRLSRLPRVSSMHWHAIS